MAEGRVETDWAAWDVPQCAFTIEYSLRVLDDIRLAVVDAFFSLPRGGAEIGGVLLGSFENQRLRITGYVPLDCEHATGPSFTLSATDHSKLAELLIAHRGPGAAAGQPVGWYHSHTRSDIFLSVADLEIQKRYFPEPWQVALVMKPHTFQPTRAGFFFRNTDGNIRSTASFREFVLEPLAVRPAPLAAAAAGTVTSIERRNPEWRPPAVDPEQEPRAERPADAPSRAPEAAPEASPEENEVDAPAFTSVAPSARSWRLVVVLLGITVGLATTAVAFQTREVWLPRVLSLVRATPSASAAKEPFAGLSTLDHDGQLLIRWDRQSPAVRQAEEASLVIEDGASPQAIQLDPIHLQAGSFTYGRQSERVDVAITLHLPDGRRVREVTTYLGKLPASKAPPDDPELRRQRDELDQQLKSQKARTKRLEKSVDGMRMELQREQRRRLANQSPGTAK